LDDREPVWSFGESQLLYDSTSALDVAWSLGESFLLDEYEAAGGALAISVADCTNQAERIGA
jgi:hypothetical protein